MGPGTGQESRKHEVCTLLYGTSTVVTLPQVALRFSSAPVRYPPAYLRIPP